MEDRLKFRIWDNEFNKFYYWSFGMNNSLFISPTDFDSKKTQQCTGLKDKNGKLIYEGDILKGLFADNLLIIENLGWEFSATSLNKKYGNYFLACEA